MESCRCVSLFPGFWGGLLCPTPVECQAVALALAGSGFERWLCRRTRWALGKLFYLSPPQFSHLEKGGEYIVAVAVGLREAVFFLLLSYSTCCVGNSQ